MVVICRDADAAMRRFGITNEAGGIVYTRTGRPFFDDPSCRTGIARRTCGDALSAAGFWDEFASDWFCLDCELMPWSAKAQDLLKNQYAAVGSAARAAVAASIETLAIASPRYESLGDNTLASLLIAQRDRLGRAERYVNAYRSYCWPVRSVADLKLAPFHLLASEGKVHIDQNHVWHMQTLARLPAAPAKSSLIATPCRIVELANPSQTESAIEWWKQLTSAGGEGMVVKPLDFVVRAKKGLVQPAVKCRGPEYLRIIYGPDYDLPANLERLRHRGLAAKRSLALREFTLGIEALERFVRREPLRRVHECVFGVLALESEPVDPRL